DVDDVERPGRPDALVGDLLVRDALELAGALLDRLRDRVVGHRLLTRVAHGASQARVAGDVAAAHAGRDGDLFDQLREDAAARRVERALLPLDRRPFR